ncbi:MAG: hypothetical protein JWR21_1133, partial [Herminiimonas sp.]|nr:hypothetical protein [Herminiimonas sp.]
MEVWHLRPPRRQQLPEWCRVAIRSKHRILLAVGLGEMPHSSVDVADRPKAEVQRFKQIAHKQTPALWTSHSWLVGTSLHTRILEVAKEAAWVWQSDGP